MIAVSEEVYKEGDAFEQIELASPFPLALIAAVERSTGLKPAGIVSASQFKVKDMVHFKKSFALLFIALFASVNSRVVGAGANSGLTV